MLNTVSPKSLSHVPQGQTVCIDRIDSGMKLRSRLTSMGLTPGSQCRVLQNRFGGPLAIAVGVNRLAIGRRMAEKILVV